MVIVKKENIYSIPSLVVTLSKKANEPLPLIVYFHGFTSAKEHNLPIAYLLAEQGFRVVLPDSKHHGEREKDINASDRQMAFWEIVLQNVEELHTIVENFEQQNLILNHQIGIAGTSMGGMTTCAALTQYPWIKTAAVLMGSPKIGSFAKALVNTLKETKELELEQEMVENLYESLEKYDLSKQPQKLANRPLLFWHGEQDHVVPFDHSFTFYNDIKKLYTNKEHVHFIREKNTDHKVSRYAILETVKWFEKFL